ncbi:MAG: P27 family phage terminase small subunit [Oscillibacter sp.]|nr:P27 family phage terminase small subunit [Oscillibacter sp.]
MKNHEKNTDFRRSKAFRTLKQAILDNLAARGLDHEVYADMVEEYMSFWVLLQKLEADIDQHGLTVTDDRGRQTANPCVSMKAQVSRQKLALFNALGFKPSDFVGLGDDDDL